MGLKQKLLVFLAALSMMFSLVPAAAAVSSLDCNNPPDTKTAIQCGECGAAGQPSCNTTPKGLNSTIQAIINVLSALVAVVAVIMIIIGGFRYVTSAGNPESAKGARNTILYAVIGLVIVSIAQIIVHFVLRNVG